MSRRHDDAHRPMGGRGQRGNRAVVPANFGGAELVEHAVAPPPGLTLDSMEVRFLAARLRRLFAHFKVAVPDGGDDARLIGNAAAGIGLLLTAHDAGVTPATPKLTVWFGSMAESNGKANWTAILHRGDMGEGFTIARSEYKDRVRYDADRVRFLLGELEKEPFILNYDGNLIEHADDARFAEWEQLNAAAHGVEGSKP